MKILVIGDCHFSNQRPRNRKDKDYLETMRNKLYQIIHIFYGECCDRAIQVGDLFDSPNVSNEVIATVIEALNKLDRKLLCIYGQHDIYSHAAITLSKSPLAILEAANVAHLLDDTPVSFGEPDNNAGPEFISIYGASFGCDIPTPSNTSVFNILVHHGMIGAKDLYPGQNIEKPESFLKKHSGYDLIICGDYHWSFDCKVGNKTILNSGCIIRKTISENDLNHSPGVYIFDTATRNYKRILLDVEDADSIFNLNREQKREIDSNLMELIEDILTKQKVSVSWKHTLYDYIKMHNIKKETSDIIEQYLGDLANANTW